MTYYDTEAARYDATRGGPARAAAAAAAIESLLPDTARVVLDVAGGTGIVGARLGRTVYSMDRSAGMSAHAARRLPGRVVRGDARALPFADRSVDAVTMIWLLHLLDARTAALVAAEATRVLRPGGTLVTTVRKEAAHHTDDLAGPMAPLRGNPTDDPDRLTALGLAVAGATTFTGVGQGRSPAEWRRHLTTNDRRASDDVLRRIAALPDQDRRRADPVFTLMAFTPVRRTGRSPCPAASSTPAPA
jgi:SAM-dependent methyltransferase